MWRFQDLSLINRRKWNKTKWPYGIKGDLAKVSLIAYPDNYTLVYQEELTSSRQLLFFLEKGDFGFTYIHIHKYYFPHPSKIHKPTWARSGGFTISQANVRSWIINLDKLIKSEPEEGFYVGAIRLPPLEAIRFFFADQERYGIQRMKKDHFDQWRPTQDHFFMDIGGDMIKLLTLALDMLDKSARKELNDIDLCQTLNSQKRNSNDS